jgi:hypothetical protein
LAATFDAPLARDVPIRNLDEGSRAPNAVWDPAKISTPCMRDPIWVYDNWAAYAEGIPWLKTTRLTEELAMRQLRELARLKTLGVHFDYYMMNAFWFATDGGYRQWRQPDWPKGPDQWIEGCLEHNLKPGLWFGTNALWQIDLAPQWRDSMASRGPSKLRYDTMSMYEGGFLPDFMASLEYWFQRGIRMFELDAVDFDAATAQARKTQSLEEIRNRNFVALSDALKKFRRDHPDVMLVAFNGFGGDISSTAAPFPFKHPLDLRWLEVFDTLYSGDTRASDVPLADFWRSVDLYNDHMVRRFEQSGVPLERIDPFFTLSTTWFGYARGKRAWKGMLLLLLARGSWKKTIYGSLELLNDEDVAWFSKAQRMYAPLSAMGRTKSFGGVPGEIEPYGFGSCDMGGALYTVVNPTQSIQTIQLPLLSAAQAPLGAGRLLFRDAGFVPRLSAQGVTLGPGQMALVGFGRYATAAYDLGVQDDIVIPRTIAPIHSEFRTTGSESVETTLTAPEKGDVRVLFEHRSPEGAVVKSVKKPGLIEAWQKGKPVPVQMRIDTSENGFDGVSWSAAEIPGGSFVRGEAITVRYSANTEKKTVVRGQIYRVEY